MFKLQLLIIQQFMRHLTMRNLYNLKENLDFKANLDYKARLQEFARKFATCSRTTGLEKSNVLCYHSRDLLIACMVGK